LFVAAVVFPIMACSLFTSLDGLQDGASDGGEGSDATGGDGQILGDGGAVADSRSSDGPSGDESGPAGLFQNGSFEDGPGGCGVGWTAYYNCTIQRSPIARTGSSSCEVCSLNLVGADSFALAPVTDAPVAPGSYYGEVWLHEDADAAAGNAGLLPIETLPDGGTDTFQGPFFPPTSTWTSSSETFTVDSSGTLTLQIHNYQPTGCILVDDVSVFAQ
jgi:hypothetical protein